MQKAPQRVLFLCTGNYYRSRFAELYFNARAKSEAIQWRAESRALALELGQHNVGPISPRTLLALQALEIPLDPQPRMPLKACNDDFACANRIIAVKESEHRPLIAARFSAYAERVEYWAIHDVDCAPPEEALPLLKARIDELLQKLSENK